jgi:serine/threonine protein kinase
MHNGHVKIIDFGYCEIKGYKRPEIDYNVGSPSYMSPESFSKNQYSEKSEIWAVGVTFY